MAITPTLPRFVQPLLAAVITILSFLLCLLCIKNGHNWGDDFALYIEQAKAICNDRVSELYAANKYAMDHSAMHLGPYLYPFGFPLLLSAVYATFGLNFVAMKVVCALTFAASLPLIWMLSKKMQFGFFFTLVPVILVAFNAEFIIFNSNVLSDLPFFFFCMLSFALMERRMTTINQWLLGAVIFYAYFTRDAGILLLPALFTKQFAAFRSCRSVADYTRLLTPYLLFSAMFLVTKLVLPPGSLNHYRMLIYEFSAERSFSYCAYYYEQMRLLFFTETSDTLAFLPIFLLALTGIVTRFRSCGHYIVFFVLSWILLCIWPSLQGVRFVFPLVPLFILFALAGAWDLVASRKATRLVAVTCVGVLVIFFLIQNISRVVDFSRGNTNEAYTEELKVVYDHIRKNTDTADIVGTCKPRALRLFTGRNAIYTDASCFQSSVAKYLMAEKDPGVHPPFTPIFETKNWILFKK